MSNEKEVFKISSERYPDGKGDFEYQCFLHVGVQHFSIGPRYPTKDEADWMGGQLAGAMRNILVGFGLEGTMDDLPRVQ